MAPRPWRRAENREFPPRPVARTVPAEPSAAERGRAWLAHLVTATGAVFAVLALIAVAEHQWRAALLWMAAAGAVDAADGFVARWAEVERVLPEFDGALLDNIIDFLSYVIVPAFLMYEAALLPAAWEIVGPAAITLASAYQFCRADAKTEDHFFTGFPSYWNVLVFYLLLLETGPWLNLAVVAVLCALVFVPFRYVYPSRTVPFRRLTLAATAVWGLLCMVALARYPAHSPALLAVSLLYIPFYVGVSIAARRAEPQPR